MGRQKPTQMPYSNTTTYQEWRPSDTPDLMAARSHSAMPEQLLPALQAQFDKQRQRSQNRWATAYLGNMPEIARRSMMAQEQRDIGQDYMTAMQQSAQEANNTNFQRKLALAGMTLGQPLQTGSSGYQSAFAPPGFWQSMALNAAQGAGSAAIMA